MRRAVPPALALTALALGCGGGRAVEAVEEFARAMEDSSYESAWEMITPGSRAWYDSTVVILHHFGYTEAAPALVELADSMSENEFLELTGRELFVRMASRAGALELSTSVASVRYPDSLTAVVTVRTGDGPQEIPLEMVGGEWLVDLTRLTPPAGEE
jgi:hypothetical protein